MSNPKVFEYAKEIGMTPLALMDKIREWQLPVKSHMAELEPEVLEQIKIKLGGGDKTQTDAAKPKKAATRKAPAKKVETVVKKKEEEKPAEVQAKTSPVIRRKTKEAETPVGKAKIITKPEVAEEVVEEVAAPTKSAVGKKTVVDVTPAPTEVKTEAVTTAEVMTTVEEAAEEKKVEAKPGKKKEVTIGTSGVASPSTPVSKKNIVGRMDLSRVSPSGSQRQGGGGGYGSGGGYAQGGAGQRAPSGFGASARTGGRNIRAGFVAQAPIPDLITEEDDRGGRKDKDFDKKTKKLAGGTAAVGLSAKEKEQEELEHFNATEFRKREVVFQPKKKKELNREALQTQITTPKASKRILKVNGNMKVQEIANQMGIKAAQLIKVLMTNGVMANLNTDLDFDTIAIILPEFGWEAQNVLKTAEDVILETAFGDLQANTILRPPVVTVMGHVDHGKTSLLDAIRQTDVAAGEAGGITQHIGAYSVKLDDGALITFLDTPGHEAFTAMRARGANATDIAVIVVAADDGVMPQTAEAINHAKAAKVPIIVAVNKIDKPGANVDRIKQQLTEYEIVPEEWGGTTIFCNVSALKRTGIKELLEQIKLVAEVQELKANPLRSGTGIVIESKLEKGKGTVATLLVKDGTVKIGQYIVAGSVRGRVRSLMNDKGERVTEAGPGIPVEVLGLESTPSAGDPFDIVVDEDTANKVSALRKEQADKAAQTTGKVSLEEIFAKVTKGDVKELAIVLKADVHGSLEAINGMLGKLSTAEVKTKVIHSAVGGISESDVLLAHTAKGIIIGFNVRPDGGAQNQAKRLGVDIRTYSIVYELIDDIKKAMSGLLTPDIVEKVMGRADVRNTFSVPKIGTIAGCFIADGKINRNNLVRLIRDGKIVYEGKIGSLKRFKDDAKEVASGFECGIGIENFNDVKVGDVIEAYVKEEITRELGSPASPT